MQLHPLLKQLSPKPSIKKTKMIWLARKVRKPLEPKEVLKLVLPKLILRIWRI
jgi:hypothetical protein